MAEQPNGGGTGLLKWFATLSDMARVRILRLLETEELSVGELAKALQLPQSTVSRHLKVLYDQHWVVRRSEGTASLYRMDDEQLASGAKQLWSLTRDRIGMTPTLQGDDHRLEQVLAERRIDSRAFFGQVGGEWDEMRRDFFGEQFTAEALLNLLPSDWVVADLGCGTGNAAELMAPIVKSIIAVDREQAMLDAAKRRLKKFDNVEFRAGDLTDLPIDDGELDAAMVLLVTHHVAEPIDAVREIARTLKPDGVLLIVDMVRHDRASYRYTMGHVHLGFDKATVRDWATQAGLRDVRYRRLSPAVEGKGPGLFVAVMRKGSR